MYMWHNSVHVHVHIKISNKHILIDTLFLIDSCTCTIHVHKAIATLYFVQCTVYIYKCNVLAKVILLINRQGLFFPSSFPSRCRSNGRSYYSDCVSSTPWSKRGGSSAPWVGTSPMSSTRQTCVSAYDNCRCSSTNMRYLVKSTLICLCVMCIITCTCMCDIMTFLLWMPRPLHAPPVNAPPLSSLGNPVCRHCLSHWRV